MEFSITGTGSVSAPVQIISDIFLEGLEDFSGNIAAGNGASAFSKVIFDPVRAFANIIDGKWLIHLWEG